LFKQGQVVNEAAALRAWLRPLPGPRQVVVEASGFWPAFARAAAPEAERLVMVHPQRVKAIASAKLKNDRVDSETLAHLSRCDLLPEAWMADEPTQQLRLLVRLRITLGRQRARAKNQLQAVLHQEGFKKPVTDVFGKRGRTAGGRHVAARSGPLGRGTGRADARVGADGAGRCAGAIFADRAGDRSVCGDGDLPPQRRRPVAGAPGSWPSLAMWNDSGTSARWPAMRA